jgi:hypothetical protein
MRRSYVGLAALFALAPITSTLAGPGVPQRPFQTPTLTTSLNASTITVGGMDFDTATLGGFTTGGGGGTVVYTVYSDSGCTAMVQDGGTVDVDQTTGDVPNSNTLTFNSAGTFFWQAFYGGDSLNDPVTGTCDQMVVNQTSPSLSTSLNASSITVGNTDFDTANLSGFTPGGGGGTVTYTVYTDSGCSAGAEDAGTVNVDNSSGNVPNSNTLTFNSAGTFFWQASYSGDTNNNAATSACASEQLVVGTSTPTISTSLNDSSITVGGNDFDTATLGNFTTGGTGGTVTYTVYSNAGCTTGAESAGAKSVNPSNGNVPNSNTLTFNAAGTFFWQAVYSGDNDNSGATSTCTSEQLDVGTSTPTLATSLNDSSITVGGTDFDTANLGNFTTGGTGGSVTYTVYTNAGCTAGPQAAGSKSVDAANGDVPDSNTLTFNAAGTFYWQAVYSGDSNNAGVTSTCSSEQLVVGTSTPTISTSLNDSSITVGDTDFDTANLGNFTPGGTGGTVTYTVYTNAACTAGAQSAGAKSVNAGTGNVPNSTTLTFNAAGTFYWQAAYSGDSNNSGVTSSCTSEQMVVGTSATTLDTSLNANSITVGGTDFDTATLNNFTPGGGGGTVTYTVYSNSGCSASPEAAGTVNVGNSTGNVPNSNTLTFNTTGSFYWQAVYSGDSNNAGTTGSCDQMVVNKASPTLTTQASPGTATAGVGITVSDTATFHNTSSVAPTGNVSFILYTDTTCTSAVPGVSGTGPISTTGGTSTATFSVSWTPSAAGTYAWRASYAGDANDNSIPQTSCSDANEQITVNKASPSLTTQASPTMATAGTALTVADTATFSATGAAAPTGSVTFTLYTDTTCSNTAGVSGSAPISALSATFSTTWTPPASGTYAWRATYAGDSNNSGVTTGCNAVNEQITVGKASPTMTTQTNPGTAVTGGSLTVSDTATFSSDAASPNGSVSFTLYSNTTCTTAVPSVSGPGTIHTSGGVSSATFSTNWTPANPGVYYWIASYGGDSSNNGFTTACQAANESITVANVVKPSITALSQSSGAQGGGAYVLITGSDLIGTTEVDFGSLHVTATGAGSYPCQGPPVSAPGCFSVPGANEISVYTPKASAPGIVSVTVINPAGSATLTSAYTYIAPGVYTALQPFRVCDTRSSTSHCREGALGAKGTVTVPITGVTGLTVPTNALAVAVNLTGINLGKTGTFLTAYPGPTLPNASSINIDAGKTQANLVIVQLSATGTITIYNSVGSADAIVDVQGYFAPAVGSGQVAGEFHSIAPLRICDTRARMNTECDTTSVNKPLGTNAWQRVVLSGLPPSAPAGTASIPTSGAAAAVFNLTATQGTLGTYMTVEPPNSSDACPTTAPGASNLNPAANDTLPNRVISRLGVNQDVCVYNSVGSIDFIIDIDGWFGTGSEAPTTPPAAFFYSTPPTRICDTRPGTSTECSGLILTPNASRKVAVAGVKVVPSDAGILPVAVVVNLTGVAGTASTYLELYPGSDLTRPAASDLNPVARDVIANLAIVGVSTTSVNQGSVFLYNNVGDINAILDVAGWFQ